MAHRNAALDAIILGEIDQLVRNRAVFTKHDLVDAVKRNPNLYAEFKRLRKRPNDLDLDVLMERGLVQRIDSLLHKKDRYKLRAYESYRPEGIRQEVLWVPFRYITLDQILLMIRSTLRREQSMKLKRERYQLFADRLAQLEEGTTIEQIYDDVAWVAFQYEGEKVRHAVRA